MTRKSLAVLVLVWEWTAMFEERQVDCYCKNRPPFQLLRELQDAMTFQTGEK